MEGLRSAMRRGGGWVFGDPHRLPERDEHMAVADSLMAELDFHMKELNLTFQQRQRDEQRMKTGVDYTWLVAAAPKGYEIPQLERLELEELCLKLEVSECTKVISLFRDSMLREPKVGELARIMRSCVIQTLEQRPQSLPPGTHLTDWVSRRATSLANLRFKSASSRVGPSSGGPLADDIEMQIGGDQGRTTRALSMPNFSISLGGGGGGDAVTDTVYMQEMMVREGDTGAYPV